MNKTTPHPENNELEQLIISHAYTRNDAIRASELIRFIFEKYLFSKDTADPSLANAAQTFISEHSVNDIEKQMLLKLSQIDLNISPTKLYPALDLLSKKIKAYPVLTLYVPVELDPADVQRLGSWARNNISKSLLLSILIDPVYVGGCGISWKGVLKDYGYSYLYEQQKKAIITELSQK